MTKFLLQTFLLVVLFTGCIPASCDASSNNQLHEFPGSRPIGGGRTLMTDTVGVEEKDSVLNQKPLSLMELSQTEDGEIVLSEGYYEADFKSYCLQPGTPSPSDRDAYLQAPLGGYRKDIVEAVLRNSLKKPDLEQRNI